MTTKLDLRLIKDIAANTVLGADALGSPAAKAIGGNLSFVGGVLYGQKPKYEFVSRTIFSGNSNLVIPLGLSTEIMGAEIDFNNVTPSADANAYFEISTDGGATYLATNIFNYTQLTFASGAPTAAGFTTATFSPNWVGAALPIESTSYGLSGKFNILQPNTGEEASVSFKGSYVDSAGARRGITCEGIILVTVPITHIRLATSAGNLASGDVTVSKIRKAA